MGSRNKEGLKVELKSSVYYTCLTELSGDNDSRQVKIFKGMTRDLIKIVCHISLLKAGKIPHLPHSHSEEEILILLSGSINIILPAIDAKQKDKIITVKKGEMAYYPSYLLHTLKATGNKPAKYIVFKWRSIRKMNNKANTFEKLDLFSNSKKINGTKGSKRLDLFNIVTGYLRKLHCHISALLPGEGYDPHSDHYNVAAIVLDGELETLGQKIRQYDIAFYLSEDSHGMRNTGRHTAKYIIFEFHSYNEAHKRIFIAMADFFSKITDPVRWKRKLKAIFKFLEL